MSHITIGMPVYNCAVTLPLAVRSILNQSHADWELLLIDDGSTDDTLKIARSFDDSRIKVFSDGKNKQLPTRLNEAIARAQGRYFARMDGDDIAYPQRLEKQFRYLESRPEVDLVGAQVITINDAGEALGKRSAPENHRAICAHPSGGFPMSHPTFFGKTSWFQKYEYDPVRIRAEDQDLLLRAFTKSRFANVPEVLLGYREGSLQLRKLIMSRRTLAKMFWCEFNKQHQFPTAVRAFALQYVKMCVDIFAIQSGLGHRLLRHRAQPLTKSEKQQWHKVWEGLKE